MMVKTMVKEPTTQLVDPSLLCVSSSAGHGSPEVT